MFTKNILSKAKQAKEGTDLLNSKGGNMKNIESLNENYVELRKKKV